MVEATSVNVIALFSVRAFVKNVIICVTCDAVFVSVDVLFADVGIILEEMSDLQSSERFGGQDITTFPVLAEAKSK